MLLTQKNFNGPVYFTSIGLGFFLAKDNSASPIRDVQMISVFAKHII